MAITIVNSPPMLPLIIPVKNPLDLVLETDNYETTTEVASTVQLKITEGGTYPANNEAFTLTIGTTNYTFTYKTTPDDSGYQLPLVGAMTDQEYADALMAALKSSYVFHEDFVENSATVSGGFILVTLQSINYIAVALVSQTGTPATTIVLTDGDAGVFRENFAINIELLCEQDFENDNEQNFINVPAAPLYAYPLYEYDQLGEYWRTRFKLNKLLRDFMERNYRDNLSEALPFVANAPNANHLLRRFCFKYYEAFGYPAVPQKITRSDNFMAWLGGFGHIRFGLQKSVDGFFFLHNYNDYTEIIPVVIKQYVDKDQPAWIYFIFSPNDGNELLAITQIYVKIYKQSGATANSDIEDPADFVVTSNKSEAFFIKAGYNQLDLDSLTTEDDPIYAWDIVFVIDNEYSWTKKFVLDCCATYKTYLMYRNSLGGYETMTISAPKEFVLEQKEGVEVERPLNDDYGPYDSQFEASKPKSRESVRCSIGFKNSHAFDELKELLDSEYVFVAPADPDNEDFIPVNLDRKSVRLESEDEFVKTFSIEFSPAFAHHNFQSTLWLRS